MFSKKKIELPEEGGQLYRARKEFPVHVGTQEPIRRSRLEIVHPALPYTRLVLGREVLHARDIERESDAIIPEDASGRL